VQESHLGKLSMRVCAAVNNALARGRSHATLDALFKRAGAPGDPPDLAHHSKWRVWLKRADDDPKVDSLAVLGKLLEEVLEVPPADDDYSREQYEESRTEITAALKSIGLMYLEGGRIIDNRSSIGSVSLSKALESGSFDEMHIEFERANGEVESDPGQALTAACSLLEALFKACIEANGESLPSKQTVKPLWTCVQKILSLDPKDQDEDDLKRILSGLISVVDGLGSLRTHRGSAHGGGKLRYNVYPRHARLAIGSAHTLASFVIETWMSRDARKGK
jgi:hypothetical protein